MRAIFDKQDAHAQLERKRANAQKKLEKDGVLTRELNRAIARMETPEELKELLAPFQTKRRTKAAKAREQGLEPIALNPTHSPLFTLTYPPPSLTLTRALTVAYPAAHSTSTS